MPTLTRTAAALRRHRLGRSHASPHRGGWGHTVVGVLILAVLLFPIYWMINVSLQPSAPTVGTPWVPTRIDLGGYSRALQDQGRYLAISLVISLGSVPFSLLIAAPAAYTLAQYKVRGAGVILLGILISQMVPGIVVANSLYSAYNDLGLLNSIPGLILADSTAGIPFSVLILRAFMRRIPGEFVEAARVDGAGYVRAFVLVVLPMSRNALVTAALFTFLFTWGDFLFALTLTTTQGVRPVTLGLYTYLGTHVNDWSPVMATAVLASLPVLVLLVIAQRLATLDTRVGELK